MAATASYMFFQTLLASRILAFASDAWTPDFYADYSNKYYVPTVEDLNFLNFITPVTQIYPIPFVIKNYGVLTTERDMVSTEKIIPIEGIVALDGNIQGSGKVLAKVEKSDEFATINGLPFEGIVPASGKVRISAKFGPDGSGYVVNDFQTPSASAADPTVAYPTVAYPTVAYPAVAYPTVAYPTVAYPTVAYPTVVYPSVTYPTVAYPSVAYPSVAYPSVTYPTVAYPSVAYPSVPYPSAVIPSEDGEEVLEYFNGYDGVSKTNGVQFCGTVPANGKVTIVGRF